MTKAPLITVFTPTYNRKDCISKCYESLCDQTSKNFVWLIIDDGSTDDTHLLVEEWQRKQTEFEIRISRKKNGGLYTGYNEAIKLADTELIVCIDSDDWMPSDAIERIEKMWSEVKEDGYVGIMGIDRYPDGECVGGENGLFPDGVHEMYLYEKLTKYQTAGDKKMIHRTDLLKKVAPMPVFEGERNFNPSYLMYLLDQFGKLYVTNECFCIVDYQPDGMSSNMMKQYWDSPNGYLETRKLYLSFPDTSYLYKIRHSVHFVSSCLLAKRFWSDVNKSPYPMLAWLCLMPGAVLTAYVLYKTREFRK